MRNTNNVNMYVCIYVKIAKFLASVYISISTLVGTISSERRTIFFLIFLYPVFLKFNNCKPLCVECLNSKMILKYSKRERYQKRV